MSTDNSEKSENILNEEENKTNKEKEKLMDPLTLLSSDLLKEINNFEDKYFCEKKEIMKDNNQLNKTQKESKDINSNLNIPENNKGSKNDNEFLNFKISKNEDKEKYNNYKKEGKKMSKQQSSLCLNNKSLYLNSYNNDNSMFMSNKNQFNNCQYQNMNNIMNLNNLNFFNNSFTMDGKRGWICTHCKNFNYESKFNLIIFNKMILQLESNAIDVEEEMIIYLTNHRMHLIEEII